MAKELSEFSGLGTGCPIWKDAQVGDWIQGTIVGLEVTDETDIQTGEPTGKRKIVLLIGPLENANAVRCKMGGQPLRAEMVRVFAGRARMYALVQALRAREQAVGAPIWITYVGDAPRVNKAKNAQKLWEVRTVGDDGRESVAQTFNGAEDNDSANGFEPDQQDGARGA